MNANDIDVLRRNRSEDGNLKGASLDVPSTDDWHTRSLTAYTAEIYLNDLPGGADWWEFDLYYIGRKPYELGLRPSLKTRCGKL